MLRSLTDALWTLYPAEDDACVPPDWCALLINLETICSIHTSNSPDAFGGIQSGNSTGLRGVDCDDEDEEARGDDTDEEEEEEEEEDEEDEDGGDDEEDDEEDEEDEDEEEDEERTAKNSLK